MDIGKVASPQKSASKVDNQLLLIGDLTKFINKIENIVDTEVETLRSFIQKNCSERARTVSLPQFFDHIFLWAESIWFDRNGGIIKEDPIVEADNTFDPPNSMKNTGLNSMSMKRGSLGIGQMLTEE
jgi:hypothetical protein